MCGQPTAYNTYATLPYTNPLFMSFSCSQNVLKEIIFTIQSVLWRFRKVCYTSEFRFQGVFCIGNKNKPPAMQVCSQKALASRKNLHVIMSLRFVNQIQYNKEVSEWITTVYHTQNGHANII